MDYLSCNIIYVFKPNIMKKHFLSMGIIGMILLSSCSSDNQQSGSSVPSKIAPEEGEQQAMGYVYHDANGNQKRDNGESGIEGVAVSNGQDVVVTDEDGHYGLPVSEDAPVFVIKPKNWMTPVNEDHLPRFYYLHKPGGSPDDFKYPGVAPTGDLPEEINFPLYSQEDAGEFELVVFGDPQPYSITEVDYLAEDIVRELVNRQGLTFGMTMGDIVGDTLDLFRHVNQTIDQIGIPWYYVMGNHDINYQAPTDELSDETFERVYGPANYAFVYGDAHFIVLDDVIHEDKAGSWNYVGGLRPDQLTFLENYLKTVPREDLIILNMHIPLALQGESFRPNDQEKLFSLLKKFPHTLSIAAHTHIQRNMFFTRDSTTWQRDEPHHHYNIGTTSGSWWNGLRTENNIPHTMMSDGTPNGYAFITITGNDYTIDWKAAGSPADHRMNIHVPRGITAGSDDDPLLTVNFFNGSEQSQLEYRVKGLSEWETMEQVEKVDPFYGKLYERWNHFRKWGTLEQMRSSQTSPEFSISDWDLPHPQQSTHLWEAHLGTDWPVGRHTIEVRIKDRYGRTFKDFQTMRIKTSE